MSDIITIGVIGLGNAGSPILNNLYNSKKYNLIAFDIDKKKLNESLVVLKKFIGDKEYKNLKNQIENKKYDKFVFDLLTLHYDKVYKKICNYDKTYKDIKLNSIDDSGFEILLKKI